MLKQLFSAMRSRAAPRQKASRAAPLIALQSSGQPTYSPSDYATLARLGYGQNPIANRAIRLIAESAASVPLTLFISDQESSDHPVRALLSRPNATTSGPALMEEAYGHLILSGNAYLEFITLEGTPREIHLLRPDRVRILPGPDGWPKAYQYQIGSRRILIEGDEESSAGKPMPILHLKLFHPTNDHYGFAPLEAARTSLDIHNSAGEWSKSLLNNAAMPTGALIYKGPEGINLSQEQFDRLKSELANGFQGIKNAGRPLLLEGGLDWKQLALSPKDMDFIEAKNLAAREIALALGVPSMLLGIPGDNTYSNFQEANRAFWRQSILPLVTRSAASIGSWLSRSFDEDIRLKPNLDAIAALAQERMSLWQRINQAEFLSRDEKRIAVGYGPARQPGANGQNRAPARYRDVQF